MCEFYQVNTLNPATKLQIAGKKKKKGISGFDSSEILCNILNILILQTVSSLWPLFVNVDSIKLVPQTWSRTQK